ncbi:hypothetical protein AADG42_16245 [Ammonicoccus fulvus]|uniref:ABC transporter permease n=1 Tax=Ammonicoccus fulvus TaxID=3138240 RepID=A0ABZ3FRS9_9ACTN
MTALTGTLRVVRSHWRTDWPTLLLWPALMTALVIGTASGITALYPSPESRELYAATLGASPATMAFNGRWSDLTTPGGITTYEIGFMGLLFFPPIMLHLAISQTRAEEDSGRAELITAGRLGRLAPLAGALVTLTIVALAFAGGSVVGLAAVGLPVAGSAWYATALGLFAWWFGAAGLVAAQLGRSARTAMGLGLALSFGMFLVRAVIDGRELAAEWATPMGWLPLVRPFSDDPSTRPLLLLAGTGCALVIVAGAVAVRRDLGGGVLTPRPGPAGGSALLGHPLGAAWRLTRGGFAGWSLGLVLWGAAIGTLTAEMADLVRSNPDIGAMLGSGRPDDIVTALAVVVIALGGAALGLQALGVLQAEESSGRLGLILASPIGRLRVWASWWFVIAVEVVVAMLLGAAALGISTWWVTERSGALGDAVAAAAAYCGPMLALVALAALAGMVARGGLVFGWALLGWTAVVALLAETLRLPEWSRQFSFLEHVGRVPIEAANAMSLFAFASITLVAILIAGGLGRVRDLWAG